MQLEICCGDLKSVLAAKNGGANRIELCSALSEGGLTPSLGLIKAAVATGIPEINVLIRPRTGDFLYTPEELELMGDDIETAVHHGATGVVIGVLNPDGDINTEACAGLIVRARQAAPDRKVSVTFHRAFDVSRSHKDSLEDVIRLGVDTLLTSGMAPSAIRGVPMLSQICRQNNGRIHIMAGAGVNPANAADIIASTGVDAIHSTARKPVACGMRFRRPAVSMGAPGIDEYAPLETSADVVSKLLNIIRSC